MHDHIDVGHAAYADDKGHLVLFFTMWTGAMINVSKKLGVGAVSSTKKEVVSKGEIFPKFTWFRCFLISQGDDASKEDALLQCNQICFLLHKNYSFSNQKGTNHMYVRYLFVVDKIGGLLQH